jgi:vitamin B12 transporter
MRTFSILILFLTAAFLAGAQTPVAGTVKDNRNRPIAGASITIRDSYDGATSDSAGAFQFTTSEKGEQVLIVTAVGYKGSEQKISLGSGAVQVSFSLKEEINEMTAVVITAGSFEASDKKRTTVLSSIDIVTTASANADVTGAIKTLPGAQQVGESEGLFVRGGTAAETKTFIDGTLVNNFFFSSVPNIAQRGRFSPFIFKGTVFSAGGYSALYGQALSSALILESIDLPENSSASLGISPLSLSGGYQHLARNKRSSWGLNYSYTDLRLVFNIIKQKPEYTTMPVFHNADANFRIRTKGGMVKYYGLLGLSNLGIRNPSLDTLGYREGFRLRNANMYHNLSWRENLGTYWKMNLGFSYSTNRDEIGGALVNGAGQDEVVTGLEFRNFGFNTNGRYANAKLVMERRLRGLSALRFGTEYNHSNDRDTYTASDGSRFPINLKENLISAFGEGDIYVTNQLAAKLGARMEHSSLLNRTNVAPRVSLAYQLARSSQLSFAYGMFYQNPERRYLPSALPLDFMKATHYILQYQKVTTLTTLRAEAFYKRYNRLVKTEINNFQERAAGTNGSGYAQGFELFWRDKKTFKNFDYWISYSFLDTRRDFANYPMQLEPSFAARHTGNLVVKKFVTGIKTQFNANYAYATGRPYYNIRYDNNAGKFALYDQGRTPDFHSLSFSVNYLPNIGKTGATKFTVFVFSITNVLGSNQVFGYNYSFNGLRKEAIVPPARRFFFVGVFFSFGVDRSQDVINSNL